MHILLSKYEYLTLAKRVSFKIIDNPQDLNDPSQLFLDILFKSLLEPSPEKK